MRVLCAFCGLFLAVAIVNCSPIVKREAEAEEELNPLNEVYVFEVEDEGADGDRGDREKRKIGLKLGVTNGILNFVFGKLDSFLDSKTHALNVLEDSNRAKNAAFGIDASQSATSQFLNSLVSQKIKAATGSIGPIINSATTLLSGASAGLSNSLSSSLLSKVAPLSSLSGGISGSAGGTADATHGSNGAAIIGNILSSKINSLSSLSQSSSGSSGGTSGSGVGVSASAGTDANAGAGINLGAFANLAGRTTTTTEDTPVFDRTRVSLEIPPPAFGTGFTLITNVSKVLNGVILNSARRTQTFLEIFKPFFRGAFAIKGLPSDNPN